jgi:hypothetical protein
VDFNWIKCGYTIKYIRKILLIERRIRRRKIRERKITSSSYGRTLEKKYCARAKVDFKYTYDVKKGKINENHHTYTSAAAYNIEELAMIMKLFHMKKLPMTK